MEKEVSPTLPLEPLKTDWGEEAKNRDFRKMVIPFRFCCPWMSMVHVLFSSHFKQLIQKTCGYPLVI